MRKVSLLLVAFAACGVLVGCGAQDVTSGGAKDAYTEQEKKAEALNAKDGTKADTRPAGQAGED